MRVGENGLDVGMGKVIVIEERMGLNTGIGKNWRQNGRRKLMVREDEG